MKAYPLSALLLIVGLAGCSSPPPVQVNYYLLAPSVAAGDEVVERTERPTVVIERVELAAYLLQSGLVIQSGNSQLVVSKTHLWAESLELAVPKALVRDLQQQSDDYSYYLKTVDWVARTDYRLRLRIDSLQATDQGEVVAAGRYQIIPADGSFPPLFIDFNFHRDLDRDGYAYAVEQIQALLVEIAGAIIDSVDSLAQKEKTSGGN